MPEVQEPERVFASIEVKIREIWPPRWSKDRSLFRRPMTRTKVEGKSVRLSSGLCVVADGSYYFDLLLHRSGKFWVATSPETRGDIRHAGGIRLKRRGLVPPPSMLERVGYTKTWLEGMVKIGRDENRREVPRYRLFGFNTAEIWWNDQTGNIVTRLPLTGCLVHLMGVTSKDQWEGVADDLTVILLGDRPHALAYLHGSEIVSDDRRFRIGATETGENPELVIAPAALEMDLGEEELEDLDAQLAIAEHAQDEVAVARISDQIDRITAGTARDNIEIDLMSPPSQAALANYRGAKKGAKRKKPQPKHGEVASKHDSSPVSCATVAERLEAQQLDENSRKAKRLKRAEGHKPKRAKKGE